MLVIGDLSRAQARRFPDKAALVMGEEVLRYGELDAQSNRLAHALIAEGLVPGERVALLGHNSIEYAVVLQAVAKCGAIVVPLNFRLTGAELAQALADAQPAVLIAEPMFDAVVHEALAALPQPPRCWTLGDISPRSVHVRAGEQPASPPPVEVDPASPAMLLYTSGTTGAPKGVLMSHAMLFRMFAATAIEAGLTQHEVALLAAPMFHLAGMNMALNQALYLGATGVVFRGRFEPAAILDLVERQRITWAVMVPTTIAALAFDASTPRRDLSSLAKIFYGSMPIAPAVLDKAQQVFGGVAFTQIYGSTECGMVAVLPAADHARWSQTTGREALLSRLRIVGDDGQDAPVGAVGEVIVDSRQMGMIGYWRNVAATREAVQDGWIRSGDLARVEAEGFFTIVDRRKDVIISGGENIYPKDVEAALAAHPAVLEVAVFGIPDEAYGETVCAAVALRPGQVASADELDRWCVERLARYKRPRRIEFHAALPRNASDKVVKQALRAPHWAGRGRAI
ncbi:MAG TPA: AMP-binding protein [Ramlibacter sp.]|nr:AMP-binding protein [Ramlibacter sp.]